MICFSFLFHILSVFITHCCVFDFFGFLLGLAMKILENHNLKVLNLAVHYQLCVRIIRPQQRYWKNCHQCENFVRPICHNWTVEL
jgi:hypothetical protein